MADFTLFRGRVTQPQVLNVGGAVQVTLTCEDYNALFDRINVGAPDGFSLVPQPDGTNLAIDPAAVAGDIITMLTSYWLGEAPIALVLGVIDDTFNLVDPPPGVPTLQWYTGLTKLRQALDDMAAHAPTGGATRYWIDPDGRPHWTSILMTDVEIPGTGTLIERIEAQFILGFPVPDPVTIIPAPFEIAESEVELDGTIIPMEQGIDWDYSHVRRKAYVRGSTVPGSGWIDDVMFAHFGSGDEYIDAPGSIFESDKIAIGIWHGRMNFRPFIVGHSKISPYHDHWRVGQTVVITDHMLELFAADGLVAIDRRPFCIQAVEGTLISGPIGVRIGVVDVTAMVSMRELHWSEVMGEAGNATFVLELLDQPQGETLDPSTPFAVPAATDIELYIIDGTTPAIEYVINWGDIPPGDLTRQLAKIPEPPPPAVVYHFNVDWADHHLPDGESCQVVAQLSDAGEAPVQLSDMPMEWILLQWADEAETIPGTGYSLDEDVGTTDPSGRTFNVLNLSGGDSIKFQIIAVALPIT